LHPDFGLDAAVPARFYGPVQLAGVTCSHCKQKVMLDNEATWCAACKTVFHKACLAKADTICPKCGNHYDQPEAHFFLSQFCPECIQPNNPPQTRCSACGARTRWDTRAEYEAFLAHMKRTARNRLMLGLAELGGAAICLLALIATRGGGIRFFLPGFVLCALAAMGSLFSSRRIAQFK
jgi:hypothetical protein